MAASTPRSLPVVRSARVLGWLRVMLLSLLVAAPGLARATMADCPKMMPVAAVEAEPPCHAMAEARGVEVATDPAPQDNAVECCGAACAPGLAVLAGRFETRAMPVPSAPVVIPVASLASIARLPEKPPPRT